MATIRDVASRAGVSVTTVSHVVNTTRPVSAAVRARVDEAIRTLGYVPSAVARSLKSNTTRTLGMLIPNSSNPYFAEIVRAVEDRCFASGYALILCNTDDAPERQSVYLTVLAERRIDGLIVVSTGDDDALVAQLHGLKMPTVLLDREIGDPGCDMVETAHKEGALLAVRHLLALGHRRIACIAGPAHVIAGEQRVEGWREALAAAGGYEALRAILDDEPDAMRRPSAVFVCNDLMAIGALRAAHERAVRVPEDLSLVGFDDIELAAYTSPPLTTVAQPKERIGALAVDLLIERLSGRRHEARKVMLQPELRVRASTATARHAAAARAAARTSSPTSSRTS
jgi:LacI family transcriptional regulator